MRPVLLKLLCFLFFAATLSSCEKEFSLENGGFSMTATPSLDACAYVPGAHRRPGSCGGDAARIARSIEEEAIRLSRRPDPLYLFEKGSG